MKSVWILISLVLTATNSLAQRGAIGHVGGRPGGGHAGSGYGGTRPVQPIFTGTQTPNYQSGVYWRSERARAIGPGWGFADYYSNFGLPIVSNDGNPSGPSVIVLVPVSPSAPEPPPSPPPPAKPVMREYHWPDTDDNSEGTAFAIVSKDGAVRQATMVWRVSDTLHFITRSGGADQVPYASISREATHLANPGKPLRAWLP